MMDLHERYETFAGELVRLTGQGFTVWDAGTTRTGVLWVDLTDHRETKRQPWRTLKMTGDDVTVTDTTDPHDPVPIELRGD